MKSKIKNSFKVKWMKLWRNFLLTNVCSLMWSIKWRWKQINQKKKFLWQKFLLRECLCVGNVSITYRDHLSYVRFMETYRLFTDIKVILHVPIWALLILAPTNFEVIHPRYGPGCSDFNLWKSVLANIDFFHRYRHFASVVNEFMLKSSE